MTLRFRCFTPVVQELSLRAFLLLGIDTTLGDVYGT